MSPAEDVMAENDPDAEPLVLVVEDEVLIRMAIADHLRSCGFKVAEASNGVEAQELVLSGLKVDLVFSDITMPGPIDGVALAKWLYTHAPEVPVVLTSGITSALEEAKAACANVTRFAPKPYDYNSVLAELRAAINERR